MLPIEADDERIVVAVADPHDLDMEQDLRFTTERKPVFLLAPPGALVKEIRGRYQPDEAAEAAAAGLEVATPVRQVERTDRTYDLAAEDIDGAPIVKLANKILADAIRLNASDVHLGFANDQGVVRYRVDGILRTMMEIPAPVMLRAISRIKVVGGLDLGDKLRPQDGRCRVKVGDKVYDLRISTVPTRGTEKAVLRILDPSSAPSLEGVGMQDTELQSFQRLLGHSTGIVIVTGPTGSGKTTTLYAALGRLATDAVNIMTVEDPVEYELAGLTQIQVNRKQGVTFAGALRAVLRQDPDIVLVGEIRDLETAEIAVQAGLTGHLVLATLHTNDAIGAVRRLADLGLDRPSIAESLRGIVSQRLVRRVCHECPEPLPGDTDETLVCEKCGGQGFSGRAPVNEVVEVTRDFQELILKAGSPRALQEAASAAGSRTLRQAGEALVAAGVTSSQELDRVLGGGGDDAAATPDDANVAPAEAAAAPEPPVGAGAETPVVAVSEGEVAAPAATVAAAPASPATTASEDIVPAPAPEEPAPADRATTGQASAPAPATTGGSILVVEDDTVARLVIGRMLRRQGYEVTEASEGLEAIRLLQTAQRFDLVITDLDMPEMSGRALLNQIRQSPGGDALSVIIFTGSSDAAHEAQLLQNGADDYLRKPTPPALFLARVDAEMRRARRRSA